MRAAGLDRAAVSRKGGALEFRFIRYEMAGPVGIPTLNHPEWRNALSLEMFRELNCLAEENTQASP